MGEELLVGEGSNIWQILSYFVTVVIGGVVYKYFQLWLGHKKHSSDATREDNQQLITNLQSRIDSITEQVNDLEQERKDYNQRELDRVREVEKAKAEVRILTERLKYLEESIETLRDIIRAYKARYGSLHEEN